MDDNNDCVRGVVDGASRNNILINEISIDQEILEVKFWIRLIDNDNVASQKKKPFLPAKVWSTGVRRMFYFKADNLFSLSFSDKFDSDECDEITHPTTGQNRIACACCRKCEYERHPQLHRNLSQSLLIYLKC